MTMATWQSADINYLLEDSRTEEVRDIVKDLEQRLLRIEAENAKLLHSYESVKLQKEYLERELKKSSGPSASCISSQANRTEEQVEIENLKSILEGYKGTDATLRNQIAQLKEQLLGLQNLEPASAPEQNAALVASTCERKKRGRQVISYIKELEGKINELHGKIDTLMKKNKVDYAGPPAKTIKSKPTKKSKDRPSLPCITGAPKSLLGQTVWKKFFPETGNTKELKWFRGKVVKRARNGYTVRYEDDDLEDMGIQELLICMKNKPSSHDTSSAVSEEEDTAREVQSRLIISNRRFDDYVCRLE